MLYKWLDSLSKCLLYWSLTLASVSVNNQQCMVEQRLINLNLDEIHYYSFIISMNKCDGTCNTAEDPFGRICVLYKMKDVNMKVFNMIKGINTSKTHAKLISCECRCNFDGIKWNSRQEWNNHKCQRECRKTINNLACEKDYAWNPSTCAYECGKGCGIGKYLKYHKCMKLLVEDLAVTCDEIVNTPESAVINPTNG